MIFFDAVGIYHQFDTIIYPPPLQEAHARSWGNTFKGIAKKFMFREDSVAQDGQLSRDAVCQKSLQYYLSEYITGFKQGSLPQRASVADSVICICRIYDCISNPTLHDGQSYSQPWKWTNAQRVSSGSYTRAYVPCVKVVTSGHT